MSLRWNATLDQVFKSPEFLKIKKELRQKLKEEAHIYKREDAKFPYEMNRSPAATKRMIIEQINLLRHLKMQMDQEQQYLDDLIAEHEENNYSIKSEEEK